MHPSLILCAFAAPCLAIQVPQAPPQAPLVGQDQPQSQDDSERGALAFRSFVGSRVVVDSETAQTVEVVGSVEDVVLDSQTGIVVRVLVRDGGVAVTGDASGAEAEPPLRSVGLDDLELVRAGRRALVVYAQTVEDYLSLPLFDPERDLRPAEDEEGTDDARRRVRATALVGQILVANDDVRLGEVTDLWLDLVADRFDFVQHEVPKGLAAAPWGMVVWGEGEDASAQLRKSSDVALSIPKVSAKQQRTLQHRSYRELVRLAYGVKEPDTDPDGGD
jgi:sporulation protein YlmC with PRC-barrel domain